MKLLLKQKVFSWLDSFQVYNEHGNVVFVVKGEIAFGKRLVVYDANGMEIAEIQQKVFSFTPCFYLSINGEEIGSIKKKWTFFSPQFELDFNGWYVEGNFFEWDYGVYENSCAIINISKEYLSWGDTYVLDIMRPEDKLLGLLVALAIDAEKDNRRG